MRGHIPVMVQVSYLEDEVRLFVSLVFPTSLILRGFRRRRSWSRHRHP